MSMPFWFTLWHLRFLLKYYVIVTLVVTIPIFISAALLHNGQTSLFAGFWTGFTIGGGVSIFAVKAIKGRRFWDRVSHAIPHPA